MGKLPHELAVEKEKLDAFRAAAKAAGPFLDYFAVRRDELQGRGGITGCCIEFPFVREPGGEVWRITLDWKWDDTALIDRDTDEWLDEEPRRWWQFWKGEDIR